MSGAGATGRLAIEGEMTIYRAAELKDVLLTALRAPRPLEIDLAEVTDIDSAGVQLLMMAKQAARAQGTELRLVRHSPAVLDVFELLDLAGHFGDPLLEGALR
ncbi:anti-sigma factor antagonist [Aquabacterium soli]|uniref:Anti-sigma factor antagonist n=1 Tax=Aquabacterium soli TaxID=2493092 RepID=A0A426VBR4_9BURK|nr:STAS domain-containing protein [Aquabacterium soli]RRS04304.1 anti-sigma factor antagonist [Aquabacterium soli]